MNNLDIEELVFYIAQTHFPGEYNEDNFYVEEFLWDRYETNLESFTGIIKDLLPLCDKARSPLTGKPYQGFGTGSVWLVKQEIPEWYI